MASFRHFGRPRARLLNTSMGRRELLAGGHRRAGPRRTRRGRNAARRRQAHSIDVHNHVSPPFLARRA